MSMRLVNSERHWVTLTFDLAFR